MAAKKRFHEYALLGQLVIGIYPHTSAWSKRQQIAYKFYGYFVLAYFGTFAVCEYLEVYLSLGNDIFKLLDALHVCLLSLVTLSKIYKVTRPDIKSLFKRLECIEEVIQSDDDDGMKAIFNEFLVMNAKLGRRFYILCTISILTFFMNPYLRILEYKYTVHDNSTEFKMTLPFGMWLPFDYTAHYKQAYIINIIAGSIGASLTGVGDVVLWSLFIFLISQLKILQYKLKNFKLHAKQYMANYNQDEHTATFIVLRKCAIFHKIVIKINEDLNDALNIFMLMDFLLCSFHMGITVMRLVIVKDSGTDSATNLQYFGAMLTQMMIFYGLANEVTIQNSNIAPAIWASDWLEIDDSNKKMLNFITQRSQKALTLNIGPFTSMSIATAITILRITYSYVALMRQLYG